MTSSFTFGIQFEGVQFNINLNDIVVDYADSAKTYYETSIIALDQTDPFNNPIALVSHSSPPMKTQADARSSATCSSRT